MTTTNYWEAQPEREPATEKPYWQTEQPVAATVAKPLGVQVAEDVLQRLRLEKLRLTRTGYLERVAGGDNPLAGLYRAQAQEHINTVEERCAVCAIGACLLSYVRLQDGMTLSELFSVGSVDMIAKMASAFSTKTFTAMEVAYQGDGLFAYRGGRHWLTDEERQKCLSYHQGYDNAETLRRIMQNIVEHNGEFVP